MTGAVTVGERIDPVRYSSFVPDFYRTRYDTLTIIATTTISVISTGSTGTIISSGR